MPRPLSLSLSVLFPKEKQEKLDNSPPRSLVPLPTRLPSVLHRKLFSINGQRAMASTDACPLERPPTPNPASPRQHIFLDAEDEQHYTNRLSLVSEVSATDDPSSSLADLISPLAHHPLNLDFDFNPESTRPQKQKQRWPPRSASEPFIPSISHSNLSRRRSDSAPQYYNDPKVRLKLQIYTSRQKFDEVLEYGFPRESSRRLSTDGRYTITSVTSREQTLRLTLTPQSMRNTEDLYEPCQRQNQSGGRIKRFWRRVVN